MAQLVDQAGVRPTSTAVLEGPCLACKADRSINRLRSLCDVEGRVWGRRFPLNALPASGSAALRPERWHVVRLLTGGGGSSQVRTRTTEPSHRPADRFCRRSWLARPAGRAPNLGQPAPPRSSPCLQAAAAAAGASARTRSVWPAVKPADALSGRPAQP